MTYKVTPKGMWFHKWEHKQKTVRNITVCEQKCTIYLD